MTFPFERALARAQPIRPDAGRSLALIALMGFPALIALMVFPALVALMGLAALPSASAFAQSAPAAPRAAPKPAQPPRAGKPVCTDSPPLTTPEIVQKVNAYFNGFTYLNANFTQLNADGRTFKGDLYVSRPGKLRFEYDAPSPLEIISDGSTVVLRNRKLATQDIYGIGQTPLKFLLKSQLDLSTDTKVIKGSHECDLISLTVEDRSTIVGTSRIRLILNAEPMLLRQWTISDPNGVDTTVQVANLDTTRRPDPKLFTIDLTRILDPK